METFRFLAGYATKLVWIAVYQNISMLIVGLAVVNCSKVFPGRKSSDRAAKAKISRAPSKKKTDINTQAPVEQHTATSFKPITVSSTPAPTIETEIKLSEEKCDEKKEKTRTKDDGEKNDGEEKPEGATDTSSTGGTGQDDDILLHLESTLRIEMSDDDHTVSKESSACIDFNNLEDDGNPVNEANERKKSKKFQKKKKDKTKTKDTTEQNADGVGGDRLGKKKSVVKKEIIESVECPIPLMKNEGEEIKNNKDPSSGLKAAKKSKTTVTLEPPVERVALKTQTHEEAVAN